MGVTDLGSGCRLTMQFRIHPDYLVLRVGSISVYAQTQTVWQESTRRTFGGIAELRTFGVKT
jgi:hypothetical protein